MDDSGRQQRRLCRHCFVGVSVKDAVAEAAPTVQCSVCVRVCALCGVCVCDDVQRNQHPSRESERVGSPIFSHLASALSYAANSYSYSQFARFPSPPRQLYHWLLL